MHSITIEQATSIVEWYIYQTKGVQTKINVYKSCVYDNRINALLFQVEVKKLLKAYSCALDYYLNDYLVKHD